MGYPWQVALAAVFVEGVIFIILSVTRFRTAVINAIPISQKYAIGAGIGLFLTLIGLKEAGIIVSSKATLVTLGTQNFVKPEFWLAIFGIFLACALMVRRSRSSAYFNTDNNGYSNSFESHSKARKSILAPNPRLHFYEA